MIRSTFVTLAMLAFLLGSPGVAGAEDLPFPASQIAPVGEEAPRLTRQPLAIQTEIAVPATEREQRAQPGEGVEPRLLALSQFARTPVAADAWSCTVSPEVRAASAQILCATSGVQKKRWSGAVATYLWASGIKGTSFADGERTDIDVAFTDLFDKLEYAFMGYAEARYDKWSFAIDASTLQLTESRSGPIGGRAALDTTLTQTIIDLRLGYTVFSCQKGGVKWGRCCYPRLSVVDVVVGARHWDLDTDLVLSSPVAGPLNKNVGAAWWDYYAGARWRWQWAKRWSLSAYGDIGGFGISDSSELTWQLQALVRYQITRGFFVAAGYRALDVDRVEGSGATRNGVNATYHGPVLGLGYIF